MERVYIIWGGLLLLFAVVLIVMRATEDRAVRPDQTATDPMFRRARPVKQGRSS